MSVQTAPCTHGQAWAPRGSLALCPLCPFTLRCYQLELQDCSLRDLSLLVSRHQPSPQETPFTCLLGDVRVSGPRQPHAMPGGWVHTRRSQRRL